MKVKIKSEEFYKRLRERVSVYKTPYDKLYRSKIK